MWSWSCLADRALSLVLEGYKTTIHVCVNSHFVREMENNYVNLNINVLHACHYLPKVTL